VRDMSIAVTTRGAYRLTIDGKSFDLTPDEAFWLTDRLTHHCGVVPDVGSRPSGEAAPLPPKAPAEVVQHSSFVLEYEDVVRAREAMKRADQLASEGASNAAVIRALVDGGVLAMDDGEPVRMWRVFRGRVIPANAAPDDWRGRFRMNLSRTRAVCLQAADVAAALAA